MSPRVLFEAMGFRIVLSSRACLDRHGEKVLLPDFVIEERGKQDALGAIPWGPVRHHEDAIRLLAEEIGQRTIAAEVAETSKALDDDNRALRGEDELGSKSDPG